MIKTKRMVTTLRAVQKKMKKLERRYDPAPEACDLTRSKIEQKMQKLIDQTNWIRGEAVERLETDS